jgi:hypothetical protein
MTNGNRANFRPNFKTGDNLVDKFLRRSICSGNPNFTMYYIRVVLILTAEGRKKRGVTPVFFVDDLDGILDLLANEVRIFTSSNSNPDFKFNEYRGLEISGFLSPPP